MKLTVLIISYRSLEKLRNCVKTIGKNREIIIIENSDNTQIKKIIENEYKNCKVILNNCNLGYAKASNIGFKLINTEYALLLNTDIIIYENQIEEMEKMSGSYESLFSKRAMKYKSMGLKEKEINENDIKNLILEEYTFLKRPVIIIEDEIFVGNSKKTIEAAAIKIKNS